MPSILIALTGAKIWTLNDGTEHPTGFWVEEFAVPHKIFTEAGVDITIATPNGTVPVGDELSLALAMNGDDQAKVDELRAYLNASSDALSKVVPLETVDPSKFDAVFVPGGHGPMEDLSVNKAIGEIYKTLLADDSKVVASVCHGPASFFPAVGDDGKWIFAGRTVTAFLDEEETQAGFAPKAPWLLETRLRENGVNFDAGPAWGAHVVVDGNLVTGQNPASAEAAAHAVLEQIAARAA